MLLELVVLVELLDPLWLVLVLDEVVVALLELLSGTQFSVSLAITPVTGGRFRLAIGVPGATLGTVKV